MLAYRNGSVETIKKIIGYLNDAKLDPNTGVHSLLYFLFSILSQRNLESSANVG
jgi:triosephosphate isomerase